MIQNLELVALFMLMASVSPDTHAEHVAYFTSQIFCLFVCFLLLFIYSYLHVLPYLPLYIVAITHVSLFRQQGVYICAQKSFIMPIKK